jgi:aminopeptidase C
MNEYNFSLIKEYVLDFIKSNNEIKFTIYTNHSPVKGDVIAYDGELYRFDSKVDITTDEERDRGLSYSEVVMAKAG